MKKGEEKNWRAKMLKSAKKNKKRVPQQNTLGDYFSREQLNKIRQYNGKKTNQEKSKKEKGT